MSWGVQLSTIGSDAIDWASTAALAYHCDHIGQQQLPAWLAAEDPADFVDIVEPAWKLLSQAIRKSFGKANAVPVGETLWIFAADAARQADGLMRFAQAKRKRQAAAPLIERTAQFIASLGPGTLGIVRLAEWGKY